MNLADTLKTLDRPMISFEFFPPRTEKAAAGFEGTIETLAKLKPDVVNVTFGAGGSTREGSYQIVDMLKNRKGLNTVAYVAGYGLGPDDIAAVVQGYETLGIETLFVIRGDEPKGDDSFRPHPDSMAYASEMIGFIASQSSLCLGAAGYPEGHIDATSKDEDLKHLKAKVDKGAKYIVAQYVYDVNLFFDFVRRAREMGIEVPILPGIMPIYSEKLTRNLARICGASITEDIEKGLAALPPDDKQAVLDYGVQVATQQCREYLRRGVDGLHFYTMNRANTVVRVIEQLRQEGLLPSG